MPLYSDKYGPTRQRFAIASTVTDVLVVPLHQPERWFVCMCASVTSHRCVPVPRDRVHSASRHRLLPHSGLRAVDVNRYPVLGVILDQRRRQSGARLHRPADRADDDDNE